MKSYTSEETQERLGISRPTLYLWVRQGKLKPHRTGRALRFDEDEIQGLLGQGPRIAVWIQSGMLEEAKRTVARLSRSGAAPDFHLEVVSEAADQIRARVVSDGEGRPLRDPAPGGATFEALLEAKKRGDNLFLSHEESNWMIHDLRAEMSPGGEPLIALVLSKRGPGEGDERGRRLIDFLLGLRVGIFEGRVNWTRDDRHERGAH